MRKRTINNLFISILRFTLILLPFILALIFSMTRLPVGATSWDEHDTLEERFEYWCESTMYKPLSKLGLENTVVYDGISSLFELIGIEVKPTNSTIEKTTLEVGDKVIGIHFVFDGSIYTPFNTYVGTLSNGYSRVVNGDVTHYIYINKSNSSYSLGFGYPYIAYLYTSVQDNTFSFYSVNPAGTKGGKGTDYYYIPSPFVVTSIPEGFDNTGMYNYLVSVDLENYSFYSSFVALYLTYLVFLYVFEVFIRVLVWLPRWIIHFLNKPFHMVGEDDID